MALVTCKGAWSIRVTIQYDPKIVSIDSSMVLLKFCHDPLREASQIGTVYLTPWIDKFHHLPKN